MAPPSGRYQRAMQRRVSRACASPILRALRPWILLAMLACACRDDGAFPSPPSDFEGTRYALSLATRPMVDGVQTPEVVWLSEQPLGTGEKKRLWPPMPTGHLFDDSASWRQVGEGAFELEWTNGFSGI